MGPVGIVDFGIDDFVFKVQPDAGVVAAIVGSVRNGALGVDGATKALAIEMVTVPICTLGDAVGLAQLPFDRAFFYILPIQQA